MPLPEAGIKCAELGRQEEEHTQSQHVVHKHSEDGPRSLLCCTMSGGQHKIHLLKSKAVTSLVLAGTPTHAHKHVPKRTEGQWSQGGSTTLKKRHKSLGSSMSSGRPGIWACPFMKACLGSSVWPYHGQSQSFLRTFLYDLYYDTWDRTVPA